MFKRTINLSILDFKGRIDNNLYSLIIPINLSILDFKESKQGKQKKQIEL